MSTGWIPRNELAVTVARLARTSRDLSARCPTGLLPNRRQSAKRGFWRCVDRFTDPSLHSDTFGPNAQGPLHGSESVSRRCMPHRRKKEVSSDEEHCSSPWWLCGWRWLGGRLQDPEGARLQGEHRPEPYDIVGGRCRGYQTNSCNAGRTYNSRWPFLRGSGNH